MPQIPRPEPLGPPGGENDHAGDRLREFERSRGIEADRGSPPADGDDYATEDVEGETPPGDGGDGGDGGDEIDGPDRRGSGSETEGSGDA